MKKMKTIVSFMMLGLLITSCSNNDDQKGSYPYAVRMTDAPGPYDEVNVDVQGVEVMGEGGKSAILNVNKGIYNLLELSNGVDALIATDSLEMSNVTQIRLILGSQNTVVVDNVSYPLSTPSAEQSGLKIKVNQSLQEGILYSVLLDFDANKSIVKLGNGGYQLKPVIRSIERATSGSIKGKVAAGVMAVVEAKSTTTQLSYASNVNTNGEFMVMGLPPGIYTLTLTPAFPLKVVIKNNVTVTAGLTSDIGTLTGF